MTPPLSDEPRKFLVHDLQGVPLLTPLININPCGHSTSQPAYIPSGTSLPGIAHLFMRSIIFPATWIARLLYITIHLPHGLYAASFDPYCNSDVFGKPVSVECFNTIARFPIHDTAVRFFVEQQMRTAPPAATWNAFKDPRPPDQKQTIVQLPKWTSNGKCNFALLSYTNFVSKDKKIVNASPALSWSDILSASVQLDSKCLSHSQGGAVVVKEIGGQPGLSVFMWEDGSPFEFLMIHDSGLDFPPGMSPTNPPDIGPSLFNNVTLTAGLRAVNDSITQDVSAL